MTEESKPFDVVTIGHAIVDILVRADDSFLETLSLRKKSMTLIDKAKADALFSYLDTLKVEENAALQSMKEMSGGSAANTAAGLASFGAKVGYIGRVNGDRAGKRFSDKLEERKIEYRTPPSLLGEETGRSLVIVTPDGTRTMCTHIGAKVLEEDIDAELIKEAKVIFLTAFLWDTEEGKKAAQKAMAVAQESNTKISLSLGDPDCVSRCRDDVLMLVGSGKIDILFANEHEMQALLGTTNHEDSMNALKALAEQSSFIGVVTVGAKGADILGPEGIQHIDGITIDEVVDKTGIGALFASGFLFGYTHGYPLDGCGKLGNLAAAEGLKTLGARPMVDLSTLVAQVEKPDAAA